MPQDNSIPLQVWGGPSAVDSFISGRNAALDYRTKQEALDRNKVLAQREDTQYAQQQNMQAIDQLGAVLDKIPDGDAQAFEQAKAFAVQNKLIDPATASQYSVNDLPRIRALSQQARMLAKERAAEDMASKKFDLDRRSTEASIRHSDAAAEASRAQADYTRAKPLAGATLPQRIQAAEDDDIAAIQTTQSINTQLTEIKSQLTSGDLELGPVNNFLGGMQNAIGVSTPNSRNLAAFQATLEKIRNDSLRLNKGVQTEGDAVRAWNEVTKSINDPKVVALQLDRIQRLNERAAKQRLQMINIRRQRNNAGPFDPAQIENPVPAAEAAQPGVIRYDANGDRVQ